MEDQFNQANKAATYAANQTQTATDKTSAANDVKARVTEPTLKVIVSWTNIGPRSTASAIRADLSKPVGKIVTQNSLRILNKEGKEPIKTPHETIVKQIPIDGPEDATFCFMAFEKLFGNRTGSQNFNEKLSAFTKRRNEFYQSIGMPIPEGSKRPELTSEHKGLYNDYMQGYAFGYWQIQLSYTAPDTKAVRTRVYKQLKQFDVDSVINRLDDAVKALQGKIDIKSKSSR